LKPNDVSVSRDRNGSKRIETERREDTDARIREIVLESNVDLANVNLKVIDDGLHHSRGVGRLFLLGRGGG